MKARRASTAGRASAGSKAGVLLLGVLVFLLLFRVRLVLEFSLPGERLIDDPAIEAAYARCYSDKDHEIHAEAFATIDNPAVQKEFINSNRERAAAECRALHPETPVTAHEPLRLDLVDVEPRFW